MPANIETTSLRRPDDWHVHLRDGAMLAQVVPYTARQFARAIVMPNLLPPIRTVAAARAYRERILTALRTPPTHSLSREREREWVGAGERGMPAGFTPLMTCYLTDTTDPEEVARGFAEGVFVAVKLYPAHATTNSAFGVTDIRRVQPVLERMAAIGMPLLVHGEVTDAEVDVFDREAVFIDQILDPLRRRLPELKIVLEHVTTEEAVEYVRSASAILPRRLPRITFRSTGTRCLPVESARTSTACRLPSAKSIVRRCAAPRPPATIGFSSAPTAHRTRNWPKRRPAVALAYLRRRVPLNFMPRCSRSKMHSTGSRLLPR